MFPPCILVCLSPLLFLLCFALFTSHCTNPILYGVTAHNFVCFNVSLFFSAVCVLGICCCLSLLLTLCETSAALRITHTNALLLYLPCTAATHVLR